MKTGLSKREKVLIFIAVAALLAFAAVKYAIQPLYNHYSKQTEMYNMLSIEKMKLDHKLSNEPFIRKDHESAETSFQEIEKQYPAVIPNEEIDRILTGLCLQNSLSPSALKISDAVDFYAAEEQNTQDRQQSQAETKRPAAFVTVDASMLLSGDYQSLKKLISAVEKIDYIRLERVSYLYGQGENGGASNISAVFEITMRKDAPEETGAA